MGNSNRSERLRTVGLKPTIQRLAILEYLEGTRSHPTADVILAHVQKRHPTISRATVYNTLEALTRAGVILRITVEPAVARYDADVRPHAHFRCRVCGMVYDLPTNARADWGAIVDGHHVESVRTYVYGVCANCHESEVSPQGSNRQTERSASSVPDSASGTKEGDNSA